MIRPVGDIEFDGTCVSVTIGRFVIEFADVDYSDEITTATGASLGSQEQDYRTNGAYKTGTVTITPRCSVMRRDFLASLAPNGFTGQINPIIIGYSHPRLGTDSDLLAGARLTKLSAKAEAGEKALMMPTQLEIKQIFWGDARKTINRVKGFPQLGT